MLLIYGTKTAQIKKFTNQQHACTDCKTFDLEVRVLRDYYHLFFIPVIPTGEKEVKIRCKNCGEPIRLESLQHEFRQQTQTPFYLFALPILIFTIVIFFFFAIWLNKKLEQYYVAHPQAGDVYKIRSNENKFETFYFARIITIKNDSVIICQNHFQYLFEVSQLSSDDYFLKESKITIPVSVLKYQLERAEIVEVYRNYDTATGFSRLR